LPLAAVQFIGQGADNLQRVEALAVFCYETIPGLDYHPSVSDKLHPFRVPFLINGLIF
jgi:hypothetical protein